MNWQNFNWVDWLLLAILLGSVVISITRGFVREVLSLTVWILATLNAYLLGDELASLLTDVINKPLLRLSVGMAMLFLLTLLVGALLNYVLSEALKKTNLTAADRILGVFFGVARGIIIIMVLVLFAPDAAKQGSSWQQSRLLPRFENWESETRVTIQNLGATIHRALT